MKDNNGCPNLTRGAIYTLPQPLATGHRCDGLTDPSEYHHIQLHQLTEKDHNIHLPLHFWKSVVDTRHVNVWCEFDELQYWPTWLDIDNQLNKARLQIVITVPTFRAGRNLLDSRLLLQILRMKSCRRINKCWCEVDNLKGPSGEVFTWHLLNTWLPTLCGAHCAS